MGPPVVIGIREESLLGVDNTGQEILLGEGAFLPSRQVVTWPQPYRSVELNILFAVLNGSGSIDQKIRITLYDALGRLRGTIVEGSYPNGFNLVKWNGLDTAGRRVPSGAYFLRVLSSESEIQQRIVVLR